MMRRLVLFMVCAGMIASTLVPRFALPAAAAIAAPHGVGLDVHPFRANYTASQSPNVTLAPTSGASGVSVHASGNLTASNGNTTGQILWDAVSVAHFYTGPSGGYAANFTVPSSTTGSHTVLVTVGGVTRVTATFTVTSGGTTASPSPTSTPSPTATPTAVLPSSPISPSWKGVDWGDPWGLWCWDGFGGYSLGSCHWSGIRSDLADMHDMGISWARTDVYQNVDPTFYQQLLPLFAQYGITPILLLHKSDPATDLGTASQQAAYQSWLGTLVDQLKPFATYWEVQNEENIGQFWTINESTSDNAAYLQAVSNYVTLLHEADSTIKHHDPTAQVLLGGVSDSYGVRFLDALETLNAAAYFDILAYHPYDASPGAVVSRVQAAQAEMAKQPAGLGSKPLWITEVGFYCTGSQSTNRFVCGEQTRAQYLTQTMQALRTAGIRTPIIWYDLHDHGASTTYGGYGLELKSSTTNQTTLLPVYSAFKSLT